MLIGAYIKAFTAARRSNWRLTDVVFDEVVDDDSVFVDRLCPLHLHME